MFVGNSHPPSLTKADHWIISVPHWSQRGTKEDGWLGLEKKQSKPCSCSAYMCLWIYLKYMYIFGTSRKHSISHNRIERNEVGAPVRKSLLSMVVIQKWLMKLLARSNLVVWWTITQTSGDWRPTMFLISMMNIFLNIKLSFDSRS